MWNEVLVELTGSGSWLISKRYSLHICYSTILYSRQLCQEKNARRSHDLFKFSLLFSRVFTLWESIVDTSAELYVATLLYFQ